LNYARESINYSYLSAASQRKEFAKHHNDIREVTRYKP